MRRLCAIVLLLLMTSISSAPAWALTLADHDCCAPTSVQTKPTAATKHADNASASSGKHAHCAAMAAQARTEQTSPTAAATLTALHSCRSCSMGAMSSPRGVATLVAAATFVLSTQHHVSVAAPTSPTLQASIIRDQRGPPSFLL